QNLYNGGITIASVKQSELQIQASRHQLRNTENITLSQAAISYWDVILAEIVIDLNEQNVERLEQSLKATEDRFEFGEVTLTDVAQAKSRLARVKSDLTTAQGNLEIAKARYLQYVGQEAGDLTLPDTLVLSVTTKEDALAIALRDNPAIAQVASEIEAAVQEVERQRGNLLPNLDLQVSGSITRESTTPNQSTRQADVLGILTIPLYQRGFEESQVRQARESLRVTHIRHEQTSRQVRNNIAQIWAQLESARAEGISTRQEVESTLIALDGVREESRVGSRTVLDLLDAEQENLDAQVRFEQARRNLEVAKIQLFSVMGRYTAEDLNLSVAIHDPSEHYHQVRARVKLIDFIDWPKF
ncbi:MAG: TolC family protein, partial [Pseudomonadota bacterium]